MSNSDVPAGVTGGPLNVPDLNDLPEKMRVHALAKLLGRTSREVLAALADLGVSVPGAQSSIERKVAEQVVSALLPEAAPAPGSIDSPAAEPAPMVPLFAPPTPLFQPPTRPARARRRPESADEQEAAPPAPHRDGADAAAAETDALGEDPDDSDDSDDADGAARRRRRRGRRGRGRGRGADGLDDDESNGDETGSQRAGEAVPAELSGTDDATESDDDSGEDDVEDESTGSRRRRRRRRRRGSGEDAEPAAKDVADPPNTVTRVRQPRESRSADVEDGVQSVRGSTRLEAKRQRRRDGRDAGRRRVPILSEAEFLARREAVDRAMVARERGNRVEIAVLEDDVLVEHFVTGGSGPAGNSTVGNIYLGRVQNVLPSMEAAFVDIGRGRNAVLYAGEVDWDAAGLGGKARRIEQALSSGDSVLVQVTKDPIGHKGARLTTQISLAGRFLVYVPSGGAAGISRRLPDVERKRLKDMLKEIVPSEAGVIIRTASEGVSHEALERDVRRLQAQWEVVKGKAEQTGPHKPKAPVLLYEEPDLLIKVVRDQFNEDFSRLVVQGDDAWDTLQNYVGHVAPELADRLHRHVGPADVFTEYRIDEQLLKALDRKVWLPSGGTLVIDRTEAMVVIDVNTGKFTGSGGNLEETVTRNNLEAAEEVVRQLRLRDIGGIIVIDFIDMVLEANRDLVLRRLTECLSRDRTRHQVAEVTSLGLVQMTRKRVGSGLLEHFSTPCEHCRGRGVIVSTESVAEHSEPAPVADREGGGRRSRGGRGRRGDAEQGSSGPVAPDAGEASVGVGAPEPAPAVEAPAGVAPVESARDEVENVVVERAIAVASDATRKGAPEPAGTDFGHGSANGQNGPPAPAPRQRRGRVTRTAGAPTGTVGDSAVAAVVTVPTAPAEAVPPAPAAAAEAVGASPDHTTPPAATAASGPRRARRAASRPAGPPTGDPAQAGGDPV